MCCYRAILFLDNLCEIAAIRKNMDFQFSEYGTRDKTVGLIRIQYFDVTPFVGITCAFLSPANTRQSISIAEYPLKRLLYTKTQFSRVIPVERKND